MLVAPTRALEPTGLTAQQKFDRWTGARPGIIGLPLLRRSSRGDSSTGGMERHLGGLEEAGFVVLHRRRLPGGRGELDHLVVGPTGVHAVHVKSWRGQVSVVEERVYVDGRLRHGVIDGLQRAAAVAHEALLGELKPRGVEVTPVLCFVNVELPLFRHRVAGVMITGGRALSRAIRDGDPVLSVRAVDEIARAAHEIFEPATRTHR